MLVTNKQIENGILAFVEKEIAAKATGFKKFAVYFIMPNLKNLIPEYMNKLMLTNTNDVDLDTLYNNAKIAIKKSGQFEFMGVIFNETDVDLLYRYIKEGV
jgi:hypothetical protein